MGDGSTIRQCLPVSCRQSPRRIGRRDDTLLCAIQVHQGGIGTVTGTIFTKQGRPLRRSGDDLFARSGEREHVARILGNKAYAPDGRYVGTLVNDRLIYRSTDRASISSPYAKQAGAGHATATADWGAEPSIQDGMTCSRVSGPSLPQKIHTRATKPPHPHTANTPTRRATAHRS